MTEAEILFTEVLNCKRHELYLNRNGILDSKKARLISSVLEKRIKGEPIQYILGKTEFMGLEFKVTPDVLIPRPETEILVEKAIEIGRRPLAAGHRLRILDMCTGCGNIAVSMAKFLPQSEAGAVDISPAALEIASYNAKLNKVNVDFIESDLFNTDRLQLLAYGMIVSNPPYIAALEFKKLQRELRSEPPIALNGGEDGLDFYRRIIYSAPQYLEKNGHLLLEIGFKQSGPVKNIFQKSGKFEIIEVVKDYNGIDRIIIARKRWINY
ncbi:MAG: peptide chain release factor N(5)-glutamine methyltransferase [Candidatus Omnitrophica bacterium]|nr:peptide chain release factor N(5)-glutamine methyltransferase [Candidatus Omnitrophota bacterium]